MGGEALGIAKIICPSTGECQGQESGVGGLGSSGMGEGMGDGVFGGATRKGDHI